MLKWTKRRSQQRADDVTCQDDQSQSSLESRGSEDSQSELGIASDSEAVLRHKPPRAEISSNESRAHGGDDDNFGLKLLRFSGSWYTRKRALKSYNKRVQRKSADAGFNESRPGQDLKYLEHRSEKSISCPDIAEIISCTSELDVGATKESGVNLDQNTILPHDLTKDIKETNVPADPEENISALHSKHFPSHSAYQSQTDNLSPSLTSTPAHSNMASSVLPDITSPSSPSQNKEFFGPEMTWDETDITLSHIADKDSFPCICCYEEEGKEVGGRWEFLSAGLKIYSRQPVLFHSVTKKKQARARTIHKDKGGAYFELGQTMLIPDDYQGWFELVPSDFSRASCFTSISDVAKAMPSRFFTRSNVRGIRVEGEGGEQKFLERKVPAGSVLRTKGTYTAKWKTVAETGVFKKKTTQWEFQEVTYLKCLDKDESEILVPLTHKGKFNSIFEKGNSTMTQNAVYSMKDILSELSLPVKVRLLFGKAPVVPCIFTGMLVIRDASLDDTIIGSTVLNTRNVLFEIPLNAPVKVRYSSSDEPLQDLPTYNDAKKLCRKYAHLFSTMIKLSPDLDTDQKVIQHVPSDPSLMKEADEALRALDLITDISLTGEPKDHLLDTDSASGESDASVIPKGGTISEITEYRSRESHTHV